MSIARQIRGEEVSPYATDPRPDLVEDSALWERALRMACEINEEFAGVLHGMRCGGTRIKRGRSGYVLRPDVDPTGAVAWESQAAYDEMREKYLVPWRKEVTELMRRL